MLGDPGYGEIGVAEGWPCVPENKVQRAQARLRRHLYRGHDGPMESFIPCALTSCFSISGVNFKWL
jgi:hypothetical protein